MSWLPQPFRPEPIGAPDPTWRGETKPCPDCNDPNSSHVGQRSPEDSSPCLTCGGATQKEV